MNIFTLFENLLLFIMLMVPGYIMGKYKLIGETAQANLGSILMYIAMPFLVFQKMLETDLRTLDPFALILSTVLPLLLGLGLLFIAKFVFPASDDTSKNRISQYCSFLHNVGFWAIPLAATLFPDQPEVTLYVSLVNIINTFLVLTVGVYVLSGDVRSVSVRGILLSPVVISLVAGCVLSLLDVCAYFPIILNFSTMLASIAAPLSMLSLGIESSKLSFRKIFLSRDLYPVYGIKLILSPVLIVTASLLLRGVGVPVSTQLIDALFLSTAVSSASSATSMSAKYGLDAEHAASISIGTTFFCVVTMPLLYALFSLFF